MGKKKGRTASTADAEAPATEQEETQVATQEAPQETTAAADDTLSDEEFERYIEAQKAARIKTKPAAFAAPAAPAAPVAPVVPQAPVEPVAPVAPQAPIAPPHQAVMRPATPAGAQAPGVPTGLRPPVPGAPRPPVATPFRTPAPAPARPPVAPAAAPRPAVPPAPPAAAAPAAPAAPIVQTRRPSRIVPIDQIQQPPSALATIADGEYPILSSGHNASAAMQIAQESMFDLSAWDLPRVKWPSKDAMLWTLMTPEGPKALEYLTGILVYFKEGFDFWSHPFGAEESGPPECSSNDGRTGVGTPGGSCQQCPWFQWGSRTQIDTANPESNAKACRHSTRMFLMMTGSTMPTLIQAPPTSVKAIRKYSLALAGTSMFYFGVESYLGIQPKQAGNFTIAELVLQMGRVLTNEQLRESYKLWATFRAMYEGGPRATQEEAGTI